MKVDIVNKIFFEKCTSLDLLSHYIGINCVLQNLLGLCNDALNNSSILSLGWEDNSWIIIIEVIDARDPAQLGTRG